MQALRVFVWNGGIVCSVNRNNWRYTRTHIAQRREPSCQIRPVRKTSEPLQRPQSSVGTFEDIKYVGYTEVVNDCSHLDRILPQRPGASVVETGRRIEHPSHQCQMPA